MNRGEKLKLYFKMNSRYYGLLNLIQMGKGGEIDLKITDYYNGMAIITDHQQNPRKGYLSEEDLTSARFVKKVEMSYHKDGSFLTKINDGLTPMYNNPYGEGVRWTPTDDIDEFQPIMNICIRRMAIYNTSFENIPAVKRKETIYVCENDELFEPSGMYYIVLYIKSKSQPISRYTTCNLYSDIIAELNEKCDLCVVITRHEYPPAEPYYCEEMKGYITPYLCNSHNFCNKDKSIELLRELFDDAILNAKHTNFIDRISDKDFICITNAQFSIMDEIDILYKEANYQMPIDKPEFVKEFMSYIDGMMDQFNKLPRSERQVILKHFKNNILPLNPALDLFSC